MIRKCKIKHFSIHEVEIDGNLYLIACLDYFGKDFEKDMQRMAADEETQRWWSETDPCQIPLPAAAAKGKIWSDTSEIYILR